MQLKSTPIENLFLIEPDFNSDNRGTFARTFCAEEFGRQGLQSSFDQCSISFNPKKGTLRGLHYQIAPFEETKLVRCTRGAIFDVVLDLRSASASYKKWYAHELTWKNRHMLYVPAGCAHGFITLEDDSEVFYQISGIYNPDYARFARWNDPAFKIEWPLEPVVASQKDLECELFAEGSLA